MQVVEDGIVGYHYISKNLPDNLSVKLLNDELEYAERRVNNREKYLKEHYQDLKYYKSELSRNNNDRNQKLLDQKEDLIKWTINMLKVEKEDLEALKGIIEIETFLGLPKNYVKRW